MHQAVKALAIVAILAAIPDAARAAPCLPVAPGLEGHYVLNGEREVGSQILLQRHGQFEFMLFYGAIDQYGNGCWSTDGRTLTLRVKGRRSVPTRHSPEDRRFRGMVLTIERDGRLAWPLPGFRGRYERQ